MSHNYLVYWISLPEHTDPYSQGYIGITKHSAKERWWSHKSDKGKSRHIYYSIKKYGLTFDNNVSVLHNVGSLDEVLHLEKTYRPEREIGWNIAIGGKLGGLPCEKNCKCKKHQAPWNKGLSVSNFPPQQQCCSCIKCKKVFTKHNWDWHMRAKTKLRRSSACWDKNQLVKKNSAIISCIKCKNQFNTGNYNQHLKRVGRCWA